MRTGVRVYPSSRDVAGGPRARAGGRRLVHRGAAPVQLRAQLRRTPCQMYRATSASESSGGVYFAPAVVSAMARTSCERPTVLVAYMWNS